MPKEIMVITEETITRTEISIRIVITMARTVTEIIRVTVKSTLTVIVKETVTELKENGDNKIVRDVLFPLEN